MEHLNRTSSLNNKTMKNIIYGAILLMGCASTGYRADYEMAEAAKVLSVRGPSKGLEAQQIYKKFDLNEDGRIDGPERDIMLNIAKVRTRMDELRNTIDDKVKEGQPGPR